MLSSRLPQAAAPAPPPTGAPGGGAAAAVAAATISAQAREPEKAAGVGVLIGRSLSALVAQSGDKETLL